MTPERIAITGLGLISSIGKGPEAFAEGLRAGRSGIAPIQTFDTSSYNSHLAGKLRDFDPTEYIDPNKLRRIDQVGQLAISAGKLALSDAGVELDENSRSGTGVILGSYTAGLHSTVDYLEGLMLGGPTHVTPLIFSNTVGNAPASLCALELGLRGPNVTISHKEDSSLNAVAYAVHLLRHGKARAFVAGGADDIEETFFRVHDAFQVLSPQDGIEERARPFDRRRNGFILGEGVFVLFLERTSDAEARGARIYAEILGCGATASPTGLNQWPRDPAPLARAMQLALDEVGCEPNQVSLVLASANGTRELDRTEAVAITSLFADRHIPVSSIKGALGESSSAGAASLVAAALTLGEGLLPATAGFEQAAADCPVNVSDRSRPASGTLALINSFASGGTNSSLLIRARPLP